MKLSLAYYGDPILRKKSARVDEINDDIRQLVNDMVETMMAHDGMGLAAPQVHRSLALFITCVPIEGADGKMMPGNVVKVYFNPKLSSPSEQTWDYEEGCLSIPRLYGDVNRPVSITVEATDINGQRFTEQLIGLGARVVMHENDHINGVLYIDRLSVEERKLLEPALREIKSKYYVKKH